jgi:hypothetical protein
MSNSQGLWSLLLGAGSYSTHRAKLQHKKAESAFNISMVILIFVLTYAVYFLPDVYLGPYQSAYFISSIFLIFIFVLLIKVLFMAVGALIRISELLENNSHSTVTSYKSSSTSPTTFPSDTFLKTAKDTEQKEKYIVKSAETLTVQPNGDPEKERFDKLRIEATKKITSKGHSVSMSGTYPMHRWDINYKNGKTNRISNLDELIHTSNELGD